METTVRIATLLIMFWNLENFFYPQKDVDFSSGEKVVTWKRFRAKRDLISKTMTHRFPDSATGFCTRILRTAEA